MRKVHAFTSFASSTYHRACQPFVMSQRQQIPPPNWIQHPQPRVHSAFWDFLVAAVCMHVFIYLRGSCKGWKHSKITCITTALNLGSNSASVTLWIHPISCHPLSLTGRSFAADLGQSVLRKRQTWPQKRQSYDLQQRPTCSWRAREITYRCGRQCMTSMALCGMI